MENILLVFLVIVWITFVTIFPGEVFSKKKRYFSRRFSFLVIIHGNATKNRLDNKSAKFKVKTRKRAHWILVVVKHPDSVQQCENCAVCTEE